MISIFVFESWSLSIRSFCFVLQGAIVLDFVCRIKLEAAFVVTGVKVRAIKHVI